jgi:GT2 family glycosyltransferase
MTLDVSFVIVNWNTKHHLQKCLRSISSSCTDMRYEIIVVDNASSDGSPEMVKADFPAVRLIQNADNVGFAAANNQGTAEARGRYLALVNSDVEIFAGTLQRLVAFMEGNPGVGVLGPKVLNADRTLQPSCRTFPSLRSWLIRALALDTTFPRSRFGGHFMTDWSHEEVRDVDILSGCFWLIRRSAHEQVGGLDTRFFMYAEDMDLCLRYRRAGWRVTFYPAAEIIHYGGVSSGAAPVRFWIEQQRANLQYWKKHHGAASAGVLYLILIFHHLLRVPGLALLRLVRSEDPSAVEGDKLSKNLRTLSWLLHPSALKLLIFPAESRRSTSTGNTSSVHSVLPPARRDEGPNNRNC